MRKIQKAKLVNGCLEVEYTETQHESGNKVSDTIKLSGGHKVHADLLATFDALTLGCSSGRERGRHSTA